MAKAVLFMTGAGFELRGPATLRAAEPGRPAAVIVGDANLMEVIEQRFDFPANCDLGNLKITFERVE